MRVPVQRRVTKAVRCPSDDPGCSHPAVLTVGDGPKSSWTCPTCHGVWSKDPTAEIN